MYIAINNEGLISKGEALGDLKPDLDLCFLEGRGFTLYNYSKGEFYVDSVYYHGFLDNKGELSSREYYNRKVEDINKITLLKKYLGE